MKIIKNVWNFIVRHKTISIIIGVILVVAPVIGVIIIKCIKNAKKRLPVDVDWNE